MPGVFEDQHSSDSKAESSGRGSQGPYSEMSSIDGFRAEA